MDALQTELDTARTELAILQQNLDKANTDKHNVGGSACLVPKCSTQAACMDRGPGPQTQND